MLRDLIDVYRLMVYPVALASGTRFFRDGAGEDDAKLSEAKTTSTGVVVLTYEPAEVVRDTRLANCSAEREIPRACRRVALQLEE